MNSNVRRALIAGLVTVSMLGGVVIGAIAFPAAGALAASSGGTATNDRSALIQNEAVIDFGHGGAARVTIKLTLDGPAAGANPADFTVQVLIVDVRPTPTNPGGTTYDSGAIPPTTVR